MKIGDEIIFDLDTWLEGENLMLVETTAKILEFIHCPLKRHESKCYVNVDGKFYGVPFSEVKKVLTN